VETLVGSHSFYAEIAIWCTRLKILHRAIPQPDLRVKGQKVCLTRRVAWARFGLLDAD